MIDSQRLREISKLFGMRPWQQEKHYLQSLILTIVSDYPLVFRGGTYLWLFHGLSRFSEDLDFTARGTIKKDFPEFISCSLRLYQFRKPADLVPARSIRIGFNLKKYCSITLDNKRFRCIWTHYSPYFANEFMTV